MNKAEAYRLLIADVYELAGASRRTSEDVARRAGQTVARWHVLSVLSEPATVAGAARRLGLSRQSVHRVCGDLLREGLLESQDNPDHQTSPLLRLTSAGGAILAELVRESDVERSQLLARVGISANDLESTRTTVRALIIALECQ
ncbi:MarR family winged helix-turn-helix transcriptional regulator [Williamsia muralis]|uniref:MarR family winged helix-turn-helix transcriptional regulator n=1 Tax=Williamsia marianensis TaxID=85044 RepID=UPI000DE6A965|nr:MarR family transcriptional regulator [Williamsia marianensis]PVY29310.1 DNA-binding MarR family transcriptional regulator [Williamsia marianensis]